MVSSSYLKKKSAGRGAISMFYENTTVESSLEVFNNSHFIQGFINQIVHSYNKKAIDVWSTMI